MKRNELWIYTKTWMTLKGIMLGERCQSQKFHTVWFYLYDIFKNTKPWWQRTDKLLPIVSGLGRKWWQSGNMRDSFSDRTILCIDCAGGYMNLYVLKLVELYIKKNVWKIDSSFQSSLSVHFQLFLSIGN